MASKTGINISGHYVVSVNAMAFHICTLTSENLQGLTESHFILRCIVLKTQRPLDTVF